MWLPLLGRAKYYFFSSPLDLWHLSNHFKVCVYVYSNNSGETVWEQCLSPSVLVWSGLMESLIQVEINNNENNQHVSVMERKFQNNIIWIKQDKNKVKFNENGVLRPSDK